VSSNGSLFERLLGDDLMTLPSTLRRIHDGSATKVWSGRCEVERGKSWLAALMANILSLPSSGTDVSISVAITASADREVWARNFDGHLMRSTLIAENSYLSEQLGPVRLIFALHVVDNEIQWQLQGVRYLGIPLPTRLFASTHARECIEDGRYTFDVHVSLPVVGLLVRYRGWLVENERASFQ